MNVHRNMYVYDIKYYHTHYGWIMSRWVYMYIEQTQSYAEKVVKNVLRGSENPPLTMKLALHAMMCEEFVSSA